MLPTSCSHPLMRRHTLALLAAGLLAAPALSAQIIVTETGTVYATGSLSSAATFGASMSGMRVTAHFADGLVLAAAWGDLGDGVFGAATDRFRLAFPGEVNTGSPGSHLWTLDNLWTGGLTRVVLSGAPGRTVFDMNGDDELTPNSALGIAFALGPDDEGLSSPYATGTTAHYRNAVALVGAAPLGDVFEELDVVFGVALAGGVGVTFDLDTDSVGEGSAITPAPTTTVTPEPASVALLGGGLAGVALVGARRRRPTQG